MKSVRVGCKRWRYVWWECVYGEYVAWKVSGKRMVCTVWVMESTWLGGGD